MIAIDQVIGAGVRGKLHLGASRGSGVDGQVSHIQSHVRHGNGEDVFLVHAARLGQLSFVIANVEGGDRSIGVGLSHFGSQSVSTLGGTILSGESDHHSAGGIDGHIIRQFPSGLTGDVVGVSFVGDFIHANDRPSAGVVDLHISNGRNGADHNIHRPTVCLVGAVVVFGQHSMEAGVAGSGSLSGIHADVLNAGLSAVFQLDNQVVSLNSLAPTSDGDSALPIDSIGQAGEFNFVLISDIRANRLSATIFINFNSAVHIALHSVLHNKAGIGHCMAPLVQDSVLGQGDGDGVGNIVLVLIGNQALSAVHGEGLQSVLILSDDSEGAGVATGGGGHLEGLAVVGVGYGNGVAFGGTVRNSSTLQTGHGDFCIHVILSGLSPISRIGSIILSAGMTGQGQVHNLVLIVHLVHFGNASALGDFHIGGNSGGHLFQGDGPSVVLLVVGAHVIALGVHNCQLKGSGVAIHSVVHAGCQGKAFGGDFLMANPIFVQRPQLIVARQLSSQLNSVCFC